MMHPEKKNVSRLCPEPILNRLLSKFALLEKPDNFCADLSVNKVSFTRSCVDVKVKVLLTVSSGVNTPLTVTLK